MPKRSVNGIEMYYEIHGQGEPLVLIMGLRRNLLWWYRQLPVLSKHYKVLIFDNRGAGRSDKPAGDYSIRLFADDTAELMQRLDIRSAHIVGISMGGYIAQELAINHPEMVASLILGCTSAGGASAVTMSAARAEKFLDIQGLTPKEILHKNMDIFFSDEFICDNQEFMKEFEELSMKWYQPEDAFIRQFKACEKHDTADRLHLLTKPTLILSGDDDPLVPPENSLLLKKLIPHAELCMFPKRRHCFFIEDSDRFNEEVLNFIKRVKETT